MAKRFTDTAKWSKPFIRNLPTKYKLFWFYLLDDCDHAGIWQVDMDVAQIRIGETIEPKLALHHYKGKVIDLGGKWFVVDFIEFQYGILNPSNRAHQSVISILTKYELLNKEYQIKPLTSPLQGAMDKDKDMVKDKDKDAPEFNFKQSLLDLGVELNVVETFLEVRKKRRAVNSELAFNLLKTEIEKSKLTPNEAVKLTAASSWMTFKADYVTPKPQPQTLPLGPTYKKI